MAISGSDVALLPDLSKAVCTHGLYIWAMTVAELLADSLFKLPVGWVGYQYTNTRGEHTCQNYHEFIIHRLAQYQTLLQQLEDIPVFGETGLVTRVPFVSNAEEVRRAVRVLCIGIVKTLNAYADGSPSNAFAELCEALEPADGAGLLQAPGQYFYNSSQHESQEYYRLRRSDDVLTNPRELFHLPFQLRWKTRGYRFSIAGYPSLYASTSPLLALRELRADGFSDDLYAARLRAIPYESPEWPIREVRYFDLRNQVRAFRQRYAQPGPYDGQIMGFLVRWPLIMATSVPTGYPLPGHPDQQPGFHEEYVLPQLLLEWVNNVRGRRHRITGITYSSARVEAKELTDAGYYNLVVPVEQAGPSGFCPVRTRQFELTAPLALRQVLADHPAEQSAAETAWQVAAALGSMAYYRLPVELSPAT